MARAKKEKVQEQKPFEQMLWQAADKLRKNIDAAEYKHYILGLLFLKYVSDAFDELYQKIVITSCRQLQWLTGYLRTSQVD
jgi:type I restriction enzyme M protein